MSKISKQPFTCPECHHEGEFTMYESVNVSLDSSLRDKVFSRDLFKWVCPACGKDITILYPFLYHDMRNEFMIHFSPNDCEYINEKYHELLTKFPGMRKSKNRTTNDFNSLIEKILIFEAGLDDVTIELAKVLTKYDEKNKVAPDCSLLFQSVITSKEDPQKDLLIFKQFLNGEAQKGMAIINRKQYEQFKNIVQQESRFHLDRYCETVNERWILKRISK